MSLTILFCAGIIALGLWCGFGLYKDYKILAMLLKQFDDGTIIQKRVINNATDQKLHIGEKTSFVKRTNIEEREEYNIQALEKNKDDYYRVYADYVSHAQFIALFPLLGILGTVLGLAFSKGFGDVDQLVSGLYMALWTTIAGLVVSIFLKWIDANFTGKRVNQLEAKISMADEAIHMQTIIQELQAAGSAIINQAENDRQL